MLFPYLVIALGLTLFPEIDAVTLAWLTFIGGALEYHRLGRFRDLLRKRRGR